MIRPTCGFKSLSSDARDPATRFRTFRRARWDGQPKRAPKKGEFFISGAIPVAYQAKQDMTTEYFIAVFVKE